MPLPRAGATLTRPNVSDWSIHLLEKNENARVPLGLWQTPDTALDVNSTVGQSCRSAGNGGAAAPPYHLPNYGSLHSPQPTWRNSLASRLVALPSNIERFPAVWFQWFDVAPEITESSGPAVAAHLCDVGWHDRRRQCVNAPNFFNAVARQPSHCRCQIAGATGNRLLSHRRHPTLGPQRIINTRSRQTPAIAADMQK